MRTNALSNLLAECRECEAAYAQVHLEERALRFDYRTGRPARARPLSVDERDTLLREVRSAADEEGSIPVRHGSAVGVAFAVGSGLVTLWEGLADRLAFEVYLDDRRRVHHAIRKRALDLASKEALMEEFDAHRIDPQWLASVRLEQVAERLGVALAPADPFDCLEDREAYIAARRKAHALHLPYLSSGEELRFEAARDVARQRAAVSEGEARERWLAKADEYDRRFTTLLDEQRRFHLRRAGFFGMVHYDVRPLREALAALILVCNDIDRDQSRVEKVVEAAGLAVDALPALPGISSEDVARRIRADARLIKRDPNMTCARISIGALLSVVLYHDEQTAGTPLENAVLAALETLYAAYDGVKDEQV